ncbi:hypothetical protein GL218_09194 [Daldinia childiae]|uniref:uncharacterized protein n=1 Tax=Daldinia childiae TaxID=326645 RepID=UPI00144539C3|nr:uncharacterized protein GL218_09194 [Daldinia childiae]KAF3066409.1 hypothetical protein GL218_09194 [Daldinia childiae]
MRKASAAALVAACTSDCSLGESTGSYSKSSATAFNLPDTCRRIVRKRLSAGTVISRDRAARQAGQSKREPSAEFMITKTTAELKGSDCTEDLFSDATAELVSRIRGLFRDGSGSSGKSQSGPADTWPKEEAGFETTPEEQHAILETIAEAQHVNQAGTSDGDTQWGTSDKDTQWGSSNLSSDDW